MRFAIRFIVRLCYYYVVALGFVHFRYDFGSGRVHTSTGLSAYSLAISGLLLVMAPLQFPLYFTDTITSKARYFQQRLFLCLTIWRTVSAILTLTVNWARRRGITAIVADFQRLHRQHFARLQPRPATQRRFERGLLRKFLLTALSDAARWSVTMSMANADQWWRFCALGIVINALNMVLNVLYFGSQWLGWHYELLNDELQRVLRAASAASHLRHWHQRDCRRRCAQLADRLDQLLAVRRRLRALARRVNEACGAQAVFIMLHLYLYNIAAIYMLYSIQKPHGFEGMGLTPAGVALVLLSNLAYYCDLREFIASQMRLLQVSEAGVRLLRQQLQLEGLDARLERSVEQFFLQDACDPLEISLLGLFNLNGESVFATFCSTFAHSIFIIQYDYKNF